MLLVLFYRFIPGRSVGPISQPRHGLFLVDSSGLRSANEFASQINFIKAIAKRLDVSPNGTRTGVIFYNNPPQLTIGLHEYKTVPELYALLDGLSLQGGGRQLHKVNIRQQNCHPLYEISNLSLKFEVI